MSDTTEPAPVVAATDAAAVEKAFKDSKTFEQRRDECSRIVEKYPDRIPVIAERAKDSDITYIDKKKYLVPKDLTVGQFVYVIRKRVQLAPEKALFIFVNKQLLASSAHMAEVYRQYADPDGFLYISYSSEKTLG